jgi:predicted ATPase
VAIAAEADQLKSMLNEAQKEAYDTILASEEAETYSKCFFLDGPGGSGKTFLYDTLDKTFQAKGKITCMVASTGLAVTLLECGTTYRSRFGLGIHTNETTTSKIQPTSKEATLLREASIIIWDEVTMTPCFNMDAVDRLFRKIMGVNKPFGNKLFLIGGDFRLTLPIVNHLTLILILMSDKE